MATLASLKRKFQQLDVRTLVMYSVDETAKQFIMMQQLQMITGYNSLGKRIGKYRNKVYAQKKYTQNPFAGYGNVDLRLTEAFQRDIFIDVRDMGVVIDSGDEKTEKLIEKYGREIFGLNKKSATEYSQLYLKKEFIRQVRDYLKRAA